ncbi:MlaC/ttg2D family ABC transporter substrate-binding protein [Marinimicrococcus flavescens]|uniref:ABC transporter substrate-binding protein n=1 Tax=Marinimicrococcus flavescens TaxID=3031815 RepID=A0AAP3XSS3_9PROT|nr:ABC transporter substrate-binding protein [Marinimicrococcus flavescens]
MAPATSLTRRGFAAAALVLAATAAARAAPPAAASGFIETVGNKVVGVLRDASLGRDERLQRLSGLLDEATDLPLLARLVLGQYWRKASQQQRDEYVRLFRALAMKTMADRLHEYGGETFEISGSHAVDDRDTIVTTRIMRPGSQSPVNVDWRVRDTGGKLAIIDIIAEGVSLVVTQRSEAAEVAGQQGIDGLLQQMRERVEGRA